MACRSCDHQHMYHTLPGFEGDTGQPMAANSQPGGRPCQPGSWLGPQAAHAYPKSTLPPASRSNCGPARDSSLLPCTFTAKGS